ncbi:MAG: histidine--tRNA ligase [Nitrospirae bacterium]|nr:histidine--tRNA ligase [Nitrospirota bacterium]
MNIQTIKGFKDILPDEIPKWDFVEQLLRKLFKSYHYKEIKLPILEETTLFARSIGTGTDIVEKEMYTFDDRDGKKITLRPEGTASAVRAYIEHNLQATLPLVKLFYIGPMFRHERPQKGRFRQFYQAGVEALGQSGPFQDVEIISLLSEFFRELGFKTDVHQIVSLEINSVGCPQCRPGYKLVLQEYLKKKTSELCENCQRRTLTNPMRVLDCKNEACQKAIHDAPEMTKSLCQECDDHFKEVKNGLHILKIGFHLNPRLVRGLDYYTKTAFEWKSGSLGAQNTIAAGGRYDGLVEELGGGSTPGIGFAIGLERTISLIDPGLLPAEEIDLFIAALGKKAQNTALPILSGLREKGMIAEMDFQNASLKSQMKKADKYNARYVLIIGEDELKSGRATLRQMKTKEQEEVPLQAIRETLLEKLTPPN